MPYRLDKVSTHSHRFIRTSCLHLVISTFPLVTPSALECVCLSLGDSDSLGLEQVVTRNLLLEHSNAFRGHFLISWNVNISALAL